MNFFANKVDKDLYVFVMVTEMLSILIKMGNISDINLKKGIILLSVSLLMIRLFF